MKPPSFDTFLTPSKLVIHKDSHTITKLKPKIRIIHIVAPEIIETDVENFRELVQRLTGKHTAEVKGTTQEKHEVNGSIKKESNFQLRTCCSNCKPKKNMESADEGIMDFPNGLRFLAADIEDFFNNQEESEFPVPQFKSSRINMFGKIHLC